MALSGKRALLANIFGTFGYISSLILWMWVVILYFPLILDNQHVKNILLPVGDKAPLDPTPIAFSPVVAIVAIIITAIIMALTVIVLLRMPYVVAKTGKNMTTKAAHSLEPLITHGRTLPAKEKRRLTASLIKLVKLLLVILPVIAASLTLFFPITLAYDVLMLVSSVLALISIMWFFAQYLCAKLLSIDSDKLV